MAPAASTLGWSTRGRKTCLRGHNNLPCQKVRHAHHNQQLQSTQWMESIARRLKISYARRLG